MSDLLLMRNELYHRSHPSAEAGKGGGGVSFSASDTLELADIEFVRSEFQRALSEWPEETIVKDLLLEVHYDTIVSKTNRLHQLLKCPARDFVHGIVGARFEGIDTSKPFHVHTFYIPRSVVSKAIDDLAIAFEFVGTLKDQCVDKAIFDKLGEEFRVPSGISKTRLKQVLHDCLHISAIKIPHFQPSITAKSIVNIFPTEIKSSDLLSSLSRMEQREAIVDDTTMLLTPDQFESIAKDYPYLIAMTAEDDFDIDDWGEDPSRQFEFDIPEPSNEPTIGVIDTLFDTASPFSKWVDYRNYLDSSIPVMSEDKEHGTQVTSLIVAGHMLNPHLDDGCGWFKVRHFGVALKVGNSLRKLMQNIEDIVSKNPDIKVWNMSLGTPEEITQNTISPLAACLDRLQHERNILFIVAGTNDLDYTRSKSVGSPADSLNSIVVNSCRLDRSPALYTRRGPVLSFFTKPDLSYYGGDAGEPIKLGTAQGVVSNKGTSFAAPWIARKAAYLIEVMHLPRDVAKALLIDSALSWETEIIKNGISHESGYGVVPTRIEDVLHSGDDEIKFYITGRISNYETYTAGIPVPMNENECHPYAARAIMSYSPACNRRQGVDYTNTELSLSLGRFKPSKKKDGTMRMAIEQIADKYTSSPIDFVPYEGAVREYKRKWDNVKAKSEQYHGSRPKSSFTNMGLWGVSIKKNERHDDKSGENMPFGLVITLKAFDGNSRINEFIQQNIRHGWTVRAVKLQERIELNTRAQSTIEFE